MKTQIDCSKPITGMKRRANGFEEQLHYTAVLDRTRDYFLSPVADHAKDSFFIRTMFESLTKVNQQKTMTPFWHKATSIDYDVARQSSIAEASSGLDETLTMLSGYLQGMLHWAHPDVQLNVTPSPTIASIIGQMFGTMANANLVSVAASFKFAEAEVEVMTICAKLMGYNPTAACGFFTFGGTGANLYGIKLGIEKALPGTFREGIRLDAKVLCSDVGHHSNLTAVGWLGLGIKNLVTVPSDRDNAINLAALESKARTILQSGEKIACIIATIGTTDAFGIDDLEAIVALRDRLVEEYGLPYRPHVHADATIGWIFSVFKDYNFENNAMEFPPYALRSIQAIAGKLVSLRHADSIAIDFHKIGYTPYATSMFLCREAVDLTLIARDMKEMPYIPHDFYEPNRFTLETSRAGSSALAALANLKLLGKEGYRALLGHLLVVAGQLRLRINQNPYTTVLNCQNQGAVTLFRAYPVGVRADLAYQQESTNPEYAAQLRRHNQYTRSLASILKQKFTDGDGVALSLTECYRKSDYGEPIVALKSYIISPFADENMLEKLLSCLESAQSDAELV